MAETAREGDAMMAEWITASASSERVTAAQARVQAVPTGDIDQNDSGVADPTADRPDLAASLVTFAEVRVARQVELAEALAAVEQAAEVFAGLARELPQMYAGYALATRALMAQVLDGLGRTGEAATICRQLNSVGE